MTYQSSIPRRSYRTPRKQKRTPVAITLVLVTAALLGGFWFFTKGSDNDEPSAQANNEQAAPAPSKKVRIEGRYLFAGTVVWARDMQAWSAREDGTINYAYPFSGLSTFDRKKYDAWLADLECPVLQQEISLARQDAETAFNCRPEFLPHAAKYFDFFNLANNHTRDFTGQAALDETRQHLAKNGIQYFGDFEPANTKNTCEVVAMPVRVISEQNGQETAQPGHLPIALCGWHYFFRLPSGNEIEHMKQYADVMPVFAFIQAGVEYRPRADEMQQSMARRIMDQNPEFVVGNSAHWVQNGEVYKDKPILYATGNFIFDQQRDSEVTRSASLDASMTIPYSENLEKWLALGESCKSQNDTCFEQIKSGDYSRPTANFTYDIVAGANSNKLTKKADSAIQQAVEARVDWPTMQQQLKR